MDRSEHETQILVNKADLDEGFFLFMTSEASHFRKLCRRIGGQEKLKNLRIERWEKNGKISWWEAQVPKEFLSLANFGVRRSKRVSRATAMLQKSIT